jgi:hypothetical protein
MDQPHPYNMPPQNNSRALVADGHGGYGSTPVEYQRQGGYPYYPQVDLTDESGGFDFYKYLRIFTKYRWLIVGAVATALSIAVVLTFLMTPIFRATP